jgi:hypothetical protein
VTLGLGAKKDVLLVTPNWAVYSYIAIVRQSLAAAIDACELREMFQAVFCRRRHQPRRPPLAKIKPLRQRPAPWP